MNTAVDGMGHVVVYCGWYDFDEEKPTDTDAMIVAIERENGRYMICECHDKKWYDVNTLNEIDIKYWIRIPDYPEEDDSES